MSKKKDGGASASNTDMSVSASGVEDASAAPASETSPPPEPCSTYFQGVVQVDFPDQMAVLRWLASDTSYIIVYILHDKDIFTAEEIAERNEKAAKDLEKKGAAPEEVKKLRSAAYIVRVNGDGSQSEYKAGDVKPAHYHFIIRTSQKMRASTLCKRFSKLVFFERTKDRFESMRYLTHETFASREKHRYSRDLLLFGAGGLEMYNETVKENSSSACAVVERFIETLDGLKAQGVPESDLIAQTVRTVCAGRDSVLLASIMSHGYFYDKMLK